jgi:hypothetical protein
MPYGGESDPGARREVAVNPGVGVGVGLGVGVGVGVGERFGTLPCVAKAIRDSDPAIPDVLNVLTTPPAVTSSMDPP